MTGESPLAPKQIESQLFPVPWVIPGNNLWLRRIHAIPGLSGGIFRQAQGRLWVEMWARPLNDSGSRIAN
jgi:hypothetical protein